MKPYAYICLQDDIRCSPRGHRTLKAAERCATRLNSGLRSIGMLTESTRWVVQPIKPRPSDDLDYKDLFRDAIHTIAYIARAAGFDPNDPTVEPPAIIARVENQRADLERLTTERAALLAPVKSVDLEEVLRLDREGTAGPWDANVSERRREGPTDFAATGPTLRDYKDDEAARRQAHLDADLIAYYRTAAPALAREVARLRADLRVTSVIAGDAYQQMCAKVAQVEAALGEARLIIAAESNKPEGAPSARWTCDGHNWTGTRPDGGMDKIERYGNLNGDGTVKHGRVWIHTDQFGFERERGRFDLARAAMLAADAATLAPAPEPA